MAELKIHIPEPESATSPAPSIKTSRRRPGGSFPLSSCIEKMQAKFPTDNEAEP
jgi:hypothetical protein